MLGNLKIGTKLLISFLLVGFLPFVISGVISLNNASKGLSNQVFEKLTVVQEIKKAQIEEFFKDRMGHLRIISKNNAISEGIREFQLAINDGKINKEAMEFFENKFGAAINEFKDVLGYYDLMLVTSKSDICYSVRKESDLGKNILSSELKDSPLSSFYQNALGGYAIQDFSRYDPSGDRDIAFVGAPVEYKERGSMGDDISKGMVILKLDITPIETIIQRREGMGETGETFLVAKQGKKNILRSNLRAGDENSKVMKVGDEISAQYIEEALAGKSGQGIFPSESGELLIAYSPLNVKGLNWAIISKIDKKEAFATVERLILLMGLIAVGGFIVVLTVGIFLPRTIIKPIKKVVARIKDIAEGEGDLTSRLEEKSRDEVGELARWFNTFVGKLQAMISDIAANTETLDSSSTNLSSISTQMSVSADQMSGKSNSVAGSSEDMNSNMDSVAAAMEQASTNMNLVAGAAEEMTSTINEIAKNSEKARSITGGAVEQARSTSDKVVELGNSAMEIDKVTEVITAISEQTNLLALNATIEAARAGEAGKGFAVVANEIKDLARQTADATQEIKNRIDGIQDSISGTVTEIEQILKVINDVNEIVSTIATAVEEQSVTTKEIATNVAQASQGISEVNEKVADSSSVASNINKEISEINHSSAEISNSSSQVNLNANELSDLASRLRMLVNKFKV